MHTHKPMHTKRPQLFACLSSRRDSLQTLDCVQNISALIKYIQSESFLSFSSAPHFRRFAEFPSLKLSKTLFQRVVFNSIRSCTALHASSFCTKRTDWVFASPFSMSRSACDWQVRLIRGVWCRFAFTWLARYLGLILTKDTLYRRISNSKEFRMDSFSSFTFFLTTCNYRFDYCDWLHADPSILCNTQFTGSYVHWEIR